MRVSIRNSVNNDTFYVEDNIRIVESERYHVKRTMVREEHVTYVIHDQISKTNQIVKDWRETNQIWLV